MKNNSKTPKKFKRDNNYYTIWGLINAIPLLVSNRFNIIKVSLMMDSIAWKTDQIQKLYKQNNINFSLKNKG